MIDVVIILFLAFAVINLCLTIRYMQLDDDLRNHRDEHREDL